MRDWPKTYLGDGAYAEFDGFGVWLTTERENGEHRIYLEPNMLDALMGFVEACANDAEEHRRG